ncbi:hypothetical protein ACFQ2B_34900 [Streptomyces stramineus]
MVIRLPNGRELADVLLACFDLRLVAVPLHPRTTDRAVAGIAERVGAAALVDPAVCTAPACPTSTPPRTTWPSSCSPRAPPVRRKGSCSAGEPSWATPPRPRHCTD